MLDSEVKTKLKQYLDLIESDIVFSVSLDENKDDSQKLKKFLTEVMEMTQKISIETKTLKRTPSFEINKRNTESSGIIFAGIPLGHEISSFILAVLQVSGRIPRIEDSLIQQIKNIDFTLSFETYVSLTCHNCSDVVQALNIMSVLNPNISHTMIEGNIYQHEVDERSILVVPKVFLNNKEFHSGRITIEKIIEKITDQNTEFKFDDKEIFDVLVIGGGPAGASSSIYTARKGLKTGIVTEKFGGQVLDTLGIENIIGRKHIEGPELMKQVEEHIRQYDIDIIRGYRVKSIQKDNIIKIALDNGNQLEARTIIISSGAHWRAINIPGEKEFKNKGIAYCPHCDGPIFKNKEIAVIGGGNSGIEAAIDLANLAKHVYVLEFSPELKADKILQEKLYSLSNVTVTTNVEMKEITGSSSVEKLAYIDRITNEYYTLNISGVFILTGLVPNTEWVADTVKLNNRGEIVVDKHGSTNIEGIFAAGDCTDSAYKQIIISMGSGAIAALGAFEYLT